MTRVFFYHNAPDRIAATAALIGKAFAQRKALLVFAPDAELAAALDRRLWMVPPTGFIPHVAVNSPLIADTLDAVPHDERLFNLSAEVPPGFSRFASLIEVVGQDRDELVAGRKRARFYKDRGYDINYVDLSGQG